jgi:predicted GIY-YIG superfamily endonuclease
MSTEARSAKVDQPARTTGATAVVIRRCKPSILGDFSPLRNGKRPAWCARMLKRFVYVLRTDELPPRYYTGVTSDVGRRHAEHNAGNCVHTAKYRPWSVDVVVEFADERRAVGFERYLKSGSGVAFARRHLR